MIIRRFAARYLLGAIFGGQLLFVIEQVLRVPLPPRETGPFLTVVIPLSVATIVTVVGRGAGPGPQPQQPLRWLGLGMVLFAVWAGGYFLIGALVDDAQVHRFGTELEDALPYVPGASLLYLCVDPLFLVPFALLADLAALRRCATAVALVLVASFATWSLFPVEMPRPEIPADLAGFGVQVMREIYGADPSVNCLPSTHCAMAVLATLAVTGAHPRLSIWLWVTTALIGAATVLTRQHYVIDVVAGYGLGAIAWGVAPRLRVPVR